MQELSMEQVDQVGGGFIVIAALAVIDVALIAYAPTSCTRCCRTDSGLLKWPV